MAIELDRPTHRRLMHRILRLISFFFFNYLKRDEPNRFEAFFVVSKIVVAPPLKSFFLFDSKAQVASSDE